jgi:hypothetical protein
MVAKIKGNFLLMDYLSDLFKKLIHLKQELRVTRIY